MRIRRVNLLKTPRAVSCAKQVNIKGLLILFLLVVAVVTILNKYSSNALCVPSTILGAGTL